MHGEPRHNTPQSDHTSIRGGQLIELEDLEQRAQQEEGFEPTFAVIAPQGLF